MAFIAIPNAIRASLEFLWAGQTVVITLGWSKPSAVTPTDLSNLGSALVTWVTDNLKPITANDLSLQAVTAVDQTTQFSPSVVTVPGSAVVGNLTTQSLPQNVAAVVGFVTALRGRAHRGRVYVPGLCADQVNESGTIVTGTGTNLVNAFANLDDVETATGLTHCVLSRQLNNQPRNPGVATPVTAYTMALAVDSQRRRLPGRGI